MNLEDWIGRRETQTDTITASACARMAATLDRPDCAQPESVPAPWHWLAFLPQAPQSSLDVDGHPVRGGFLPPIDLPRRMWAAGRMRFLAPVPVGVPLTRVSEIVSVDEKAGRSGRLVFVTVRHTIGSQAGDLLVEEQDIVYREAARPGAVLAGEPAPDDPQWSREIRPDPALLFRFSALTFNAHRIHYDRRYATEAEGYGGLVVHGPLLATLLLDALRHEGGVPGVGTFEFRAVRPVLDTGPFRLQGRVDADGGHSLWVADSDGALCMRARAG